VPTLLHWFLAHSDARTPCEKSNSFRIVSVRVYLMPFS
jgi:hypothetical protein